MSFLVTTTTARTRPNVVAQLRAHRNALVVVFTIILVFAALVILDYPLRPLSSTIEIGQVQLIPTIHDVSSSVAILQLTDTELGVTYHPFRRPEDSEMMANHNVRPIREHALIPDDCLDVWISWGQWEGPCADAPIEESRIDLVYIWVNGSYVLLSLLSRPSSFSL